MSENIPQDASQKNDSATPPLDRVRLEMERWLDVARTTGERALETLGLVSSGKPIWPAVDVLELDSSVVVLVDLPGVAAEAVELSLVGNMMTVKACRQPMELPESTRRHLIERPSVRYERSIPLPASANLDDIRAETRDGLLTVTIQKSVPAPGRSIPVARAAAKPANPD